jgi:putative acetyltransferase
VTTEVRVRAETAAECAAVRQVNEQAFGRKDEADLVERPHAAGKVVISLVAEEASELVGHILFSPVAIDGARGACAALALAPMAVLPARQRRGIGTRLVEAGLAACRQRGERRVVVLGRPTYYPRFGFVPASRFGVRCEYNAPDEAFMALELVPGAFAGCSGIARFSPEFGAP